MAKGTKTIDPSGKPGSKDEKAKKESKRKQHPLVGSKDDNVYPFAEMPDDFDFVKMKSLNKKDFESDHQFFIYKAADADYRAEDYRERAEEAKTLGSSKERAKAKRLVKMQEKIAELRAQLEEDGVNVDALLENAAAKN